MLENPYFRESEFVCKCGKCVKPGNVPSDKLIRALVWVRETFDSPVIINSGYRCPAHNAKVGGAKNSQHTIGSAADFVVKGHRTEEVFRVVMDKFKDEGFGIAIKKNKQNPYGGFVHLDSRGHFATWEYK